jgi:uncharacterized protein (DUF488 family)
LNFTIYTTGFTKWQARNFFTFLKQKEITALIDIRRFPHSQLSGFTKSNNFAYFLEELANCQYYHFESLAPQQEDFRRYKKNEIDWETFKNIYIESISSEYSKFEINEILNILTYKNVLLLCSEVDYEYCHRSLLTTYISNLHKDLNISHVNHMGVSYKN